MISFKQLGKLAVVLVTMFIAVRTTVFGINLADLADNPRIAALLVVCAAIPIGVIIFFAGCRLLDVFTVREWLAIPFVGKFLKIKGVTTHENR